MISAAALALQHVADRFFIQILLSQDADHKNTPVDQADGIINVAADEKGISGTALFVHGKS